MIDEPPKSTRSPEEWLRLAHIAFKQAGSLSGAARLLGCEVKKVRQLAAAFPELNGYLTGATPPTEAEAAMKPILIRPSVPGTEIQKAKAIDAEDNQLRAGLEAAGLDPKLFREAEGMRDLARVSFASLVEMVNGGNSVLYLEMKAELKEMTRRLNEEEMDPELEQALREDRSNLLKHVIDLGRSINEASLTAARIKALKAGNKGKGKPGFGMGVAFESEGGKVRVAVGGRTDGAN